MGAVHTAFLQTITDNANPTSGDVPVVVPGGGKGPGQCQDVAWTTAYPALSAFQHTYYGDARVAARHWPALQKYTANLVTNAAAQAPGRLPVCSSFKDWLWAGACTGAPAGSSCPVGQEMAGFSYVVGLRAMAAMAATVPPVNVCASAPELSVLQLGCPGGATISKIEWSSFGTPVLGADCGAWASNATCDKDDANVTATMTALCVGKTSCAVPVVQGHIFGPDPCALVKKTLAARATCTGSAESYGELADAGATAFHQQYYNPQLGAYGGDGGAVQTLTLPALAIGAAPAAVQPAVVAALASDVAARGYKLSVGAVTSKILLNLLSENGQHETALRVATGTDEPSWGYWLTQNATTCWESWPKVSTVDVPKNGQSFNHIFLCGGVSEWMWKHLAGLTPVAPGFAEVRVAPRVHPTQGPAAASAAFRSRAGNITSSWRLPAADGGRTVALNVSLPIGVRRATVVVPKPFERVPVPPATVCASAPELSVLQLGCREVAGATISKIEWSSFGTPVLGADCGAWASNATCDKDDANVTATLTALCVGKASCAVPVVQGHIFGPDPCALVKKTLAARATCTGGERTRVVAAARVTEGGTLVWDGKVLVGAPSGISGATDQPEGVAFEVSNGAFEFATTVAAASA